jgi:type VI secretion system protein ImpM
MSAPGWYGKIASLGDFASRRLAPEWIQACDRWLAAGVAASRHQLGDAWLNAYLAAPLMRFAWGPGVVDSQWWFGVLMPSCDNVGRYFPLMIATPRNTPPADRFALDHLELWWNGAASAAIGTLADGSDLAQFERALEELPPWPAVRPAQPWAGGPLAQLHTLPPGTSLTDIVHALAAAQFTHHLHGHGFWWSWRPQGGASSCRIVPGLPAAELFARLLEIAA